jgi:hypothetical protein
VHAEASLVAWNFNLHNCLSPFLTWADGMATPPKKEKEKKFLPPLLPKKKKPDPSR